MNLPAAHLVARLGIAFREPQLLERALTHSSYSQDHPGTESNQRLEFLGDAVLQLILTEELFRLYPLDREGDLSRRRAALTRGEFLAHLARELGLDACLRFGTAEEATGGRARAGASEDAFEALVGALYLDSGFAVARERVLAFYGDLPVRLSRTEDTFNPKGRLQELVQPLHGNDALHYEVVRTEGADHARAFEVAVFLLDRRLGLGRGTSKKLAEEAAARAALETLKPAS
jgi:ribonuclease III